MSYDSAVLGAVLRSVPTINDIPGRVNDAIKSAGLPWQFVMAASPFSTTVSFGYFYQGSWLWSDQRAARAATTQDTIMGVAAAVLKAWAVCAGSWALHGSPVESYGVDGEGNPLYWPPKSS
jgi:hypothetical protein